MDISAKFESFSLLHIPADQHAPVLATAVAVAMLHREALGYSRESVQQLTRKVCGDLRTLGVVVADDCAEIANRLRIPYLAYTQSPVSRLLLLANGAVPYPDMDGTEGDALNHLATLPGLVELILFSYFHHSGESVSPPMDDLGSEQS